MATKPILDQFSVPDAEAVLLAAPNAFYRVLDIGGAYPDGMPLVNWPETNPKAFTLLLRPASLASFMAAMFFVDALQERDGDVRVKLILPNIPGARQDRMNSVGDYLFTAKSIAREINMRGFRSVVCLDPHSEVAPALIDRCQVVHLTYKEMVTSVEGWHLTGIDYSKYAGVISPDAGADKRATIIARSMRKPLYHAWKTRDVGTGTISGFGTEPLSPGKYLVVDDICDGGGTFIGLSAKIAEQGCSADLFVTHGYFTKGTKPLLDCFANVYCTDSVTGEKPGVVVLPICNLLTRELL
jgi:ribose-phosphate pyrophosphokinase